MFSPVFFAFISIRHFHITPRFAVCRLFFDDTRAEALIRQRRCARFSPITPFSP
jgi:hypothetical protein